MLFRGLIVLATIEQQNKGQLSSRNRLARKDIHCSPLQRIIRQSSYNTEKDRQIVEGCGPNPAFASTIV